MCLGLFTPFSQPLAKQGRMHRLYASIFKLWDGKEEWEHRPWTPHPLLRKGECVFYSVRDRCIMSGRIMTLLQMLYRDKVWYRGMHMSRKGEKPAALGLEASLARVWLPSVWPGTRWGGLR